jgi:tetratricopeptide (TPR) repeat protein
LRWAGWRRASTCAAQARQPRRAAAYFKGLNLLLNEQQDKAIDAFIEAVQNDPDTTELHFALGNLFRRRGEFERAVRVHQHLLGRADLKAGDRDRAQHALAQDFMKAGLFDRAEPPTTRWPAHAYDAEARLALLSLYERSATGCARPKWPRAARSRGSGSLPSAWRTTNANWREADAAAGRRRLGGPGPCAPMRPRRSRAAAAGADRPAPGAKAACRSAGRLGRTAPLQPGRLRAGGGRLRRQRAACGLQAARATGAGRGAAHSLPGVELLRALERLEPPATERLPRLLDHLQQHPSLSAALDLLEVPHDLWTEAAWQALREAVARAAKPLQRYRCAACGFEAQHYFWQCPGCLSWDSYPPQRIDA